MGYINKKSTQTLLIIPRRRRATRSLHALIATWSRIPLIHLSLPGLLLRFRGLSLFLGLFFLPELYTGIIQGGYDHDCCTLVVS